MVRVLPPDCGAEGDIGDEVLVLQAHPCSRTSVAITGLDYIGRRQQRA